MDDGATPELDELHQDMQDSAADMAEILAGQGLPAQFDQEGVESLETFLAGQDPDQALANPMLVMGAGAFLGTVMQRRVGGLWTHDPTSETFAGQFVLELDNDSIVWPMERVAKRLVNGPEDALPAYAWYFGRANLDTGGDGDDVEHAVTQQAPATQPPATHPAKRGPMAKLMDRLRGN